MHVDEEAPSAGVVGQLGVVDAYLHRPGLGDVDERLRPTLRHLSADADHKRVLAQAREGEVGRRRGVGLAVRVVDAPAEGAAEVDRDRGVGIRREVDGLARPYGRFCSFGGAVVRLFSVTTKGIKA